MCLNIFLKTTLLLFILSPVLRAQQVPDLDFSVSIEAPHYTEGTGPVIGIDGGHNNLHQLDGGFAPFAKLARADGYRVKAVPALDPGKLEALDILIIANALHASNVGNWQNPVPSAFSEAEIDLLEQWVRAGGKLWVIADHMPYGGAARALAERFGFQYENGFVMRKEQAWPPDLYTKSDGNLNDNILTRHLDTLAGFTGSALKAPEGALVAGTFLPTHQLLLPEVAWQFDEKTEVGSVDGYVLGAVQAYGLGKVAFFTEAAMFTAQIVQEKFKVGFNSPVAPYNQQFALNILHWLEGEAAGEIVGQLLAKQAVAFENNNMDAVAACYAQDGIIYEPTGEEIIGATAIRDYWKRLTDRAVAWDSEILEAEQVGPQIIAVCRFDIRFKRPDGQTVNARSKAMITFKKEAGLYKIHRDFYLPLPK